MKNGDRVKVVNTVYLSQELSVGQTGTVLECDDLSVLVAMDNGYTPNLMNSVFEVAGLRCDGWNFLAEELEVIVDKVEAVA